MIDIMSRTESRTNAGLIKNVLERSPLMNFVYTEFFPAQRHTFYKEGALPASTFRQKNAAFTGNDTAPQEPFHVEMKDFGLTYTIDHLDIEEATRFNRDYRTSALMEASDSIALDMKKYYLGKGAANNQPVGIYQWIEEYNDTSNNILKIHANGTGGASGTDANISTIGAENLIVRMEQLRAQIMPDFFVTNSNIISQMLGLTVGTAQNNALANYLQPVMMDIMGRQVQIYKWMNIPIFDIGQDSQDNDIMQFNETDGSGSVSSSIVGVRASRTGAVLMHMYQDMVRVKEYMQDDQAKLIVSSPHLVEVRQKASVGRLIGILTG